MTTLKDIKNGQTITQKPIYKVKPFVIISDKEPGIILSAGTIEKFLNDPVVSSGYYDKCEVKIREYDLYMNDNTKIDEPAQGMTIRELRSYLFQFTNQEKLIDADIIEKLKNIVE